MEEEESLGKRIFLMARVAVSLALTLLGVLYGGDRNHL